MRWLIVTASLCASAPVGAESVAIDSAVYLERPHNGATRVEPATRLVPGDRVVTILRWAAPRRGSYTVTSAVPPGLELRSASHPSLQISSDGGRNWTRLADPDKIPSDTTHLRWRVGGEGRFSYRAVVR